MFAYNYKCIFFFDVATRVFVDTHVAYVLLWTVSEDDHIEI